MQVTKAAPPAKTPSETALETIGQVNQKIDASGAAHIAPVKDVSEIVGVAKKASDEDLLDAGTKAGLKAHNIAVGNLNICQQSGEHQGQVGEAIRALQNVPNLGKDPALAGAKAAVDHAVAKRGETIAAVDANSTAIAQLRTTTYDCTPPAPPAEPAPAPGKKSQKPN